jgi:DNA-directed RNA polymerase subunit RPC12/RpoP
MLKKDVEEFKRNGGETMVTQVECPYCHQRIMVEVMPDFDTLDENLKRQLAVEYCTCEEAVFEALMLNENPNPPAMLGRIV